MGTNVNVSLQRPLNRAYIEVPASVLGCEKTTPGL